MNDHIFGYWDEPIGKPTPHTASGKSLADRDGIEFHSLNEEEEKNLIEFLQSDDYQEWQNEIMEQEKIGETKENRFYGVVKVKKADLISPTEGQLLAYYMDYGFSTIEDVLTEYSKEEMLREWYVNTNFTYDNETHRQNHSIQHIDWDSEFEEVDVISEKEWNDYQKYSY